MILTTQEVMVSREMAQVLQYFSSTVGNSDRFPISWGRCVRAWECHWPWWGGRSWRAEPTWPRVHLPPTYDCLKRTCQSKVVSRQSSWDDARLTTARLIWTCPEQKRHKVLYQCILKKKWKRRVKIRYRIFGICTKLALLIIRNGFDEKAWSPQRPTDIITRHQRLVFLLLIYEQQWKKVARNPKPWNSDSTIQKKITST